MCMLDVDDATGKYKQPYTPQGRQKVLEGTDHGACASMHTLRGCGGMLPWGKKF